MNYYPDKKQALLYKKEYNIIPISLSFILDNIDPLSILNKLQRVNKQIFLLESFEDEKVWKRYSYIGFNLRLEITQKDNKLKIKSKSKTIKLDCKKPHPYIRNILDENKSPKILNLPPFTGGLVGYFSYDFISYSEPSLKLDSIDEEGFNDIDLMLFDKIIAIDNLEKKIFLIINVKRDNFDSNYEKATLELKSIYKLINEEENSKEEKGKLTSSLKPLFSEDQFCKMVEKAKKYIYEGDIFQVVLSNSLVSSYEGSLKSAYIYLRKTNPSPYMFYFSSDSIEFTGASPETLVKLEESKLTTFPLAGTRKRGRNKKEDLELEKELLTDSKERAEHNMLVDLSRNDIGKISKFGSVNVEQYMKILKFSHVMHIGSTVSGEIKDNLDSLDAIDSILPAGTLSGAPKIRACEIINELENNKRGIYGGAIGYLSFTGGLDTCIAIRLAYKKNKNVYVRSGAGIVSDSVAKKEYRECINKAKAVINALKDN